MSHIRGILAYAFAGVMIGLLWSRLATPFGPFAGVVAALVIIAPVWYICHYRGAIPQSKEQIAIDMGAAIGTTVLVRGTLTYGFSQLVLALPTFFYMAIGAVLAGWLYSKIEKGGRR